MRWVPLLFLAGCTRPPAPTTAPIPIANVSTPSSSHAPTGWVSPPVPAPNEFCVERDLQDMRNADIDYKLHLEICAVNDELVARLVLLRGDHQLKQTIQTRKGTDPLDVSLAINAVLVGPTGDAIVLEEQEPTWTVVTAWAFDGNKWRSVFSTSNPHIWVGRHHAAREERTKVVTCMQRDAMTCSEKTDRHEAWSWNGSKIEMEPCDPVSCY